MESRLKSTLARVGYAEKAGAFRTIYLILVPLVLLVCMQIIACGNSVTENDSSQTRAVNLDKSLMCPVCPGESLDQSQTQLAYQMKSVIRVKINEGWSDRQILDYFVERYGSSVLLEPETEGVSLLVWVVPPVGVLLSLTVLLMVLRSRVIRSNRDDIGV
mgnify:CR=1 FL=1